MTTDLTHEKAVELVGRLGENRIAQIIATGASPAELMEAKILAMQDEYPGTDKEALRSEVVHRLYDLLRVDLPEPREA